MQAPYHPLPHEPPQPQECENCSFVLQLLQERDKEILALRKKQQKYDKVSNILKCLFYLFQCKMLIMACICAFIGADSPEV